jgi:hypothetical protein
LGFKNAAYNSNLATRHILDRRNLTLKSGETWLCYFRYSKYYPSLREDLIMKIGDHGSRRFRVCKRFAFE